jgi:TolB protein
VLLLAAAGCGAPSATKSPGPDRRSPAGWELAVVRNGDIFLVTKPAGPAARLTDGLHASDPRFSADGRYIAFLDGGLAAPSSQDRLGVVGADGKGLRLLKLPQTIQPQDFAWNPKRDILAVWGGSLAMLRPGDSPQVVVRPKGTVSTFAWAPDGQGYAYTVTPPTEDFPNATDKLYAVADKAPGNLLVTSPNYSGLELQGYWPNGQGLLYWVDPLHSASLAADGLGLESLSLAGGQPKNLATTLPYPSWVQPGGQTSVVLVAGPGRQTWTQKQLERCDPATGSCAALNTGAGQVALDPAGTASGNIAWVTATDLGGSGWGEVSSQAGLTKWQGTRTLYVGFDGKGAQEAKLVAKGDVYDPQFSPDGRSLLYVQANELKLWRSGRGAETLADLPQGQVTDYYGFRSYSQFAWYPGRAGN